MTLRQIANITIAIVFFGISTFHVMATAIYLSPPNLFKRDYQALAKIYMDSFFYQNWHLFSPNPGYTYSAAWVRCDIGGKLTNWMDPMGSLVKEHYRFRVTGVGKLLYVYRDIPRDAYYEFRDNERRFCEKIPEDSEKFSACLEKATSETKASEKYKRLEEFVSRSCANLGSDPSSRQKHLIKVLHFWPKKFSETLESGPLENSTTNAKWSKIEEIDFVKEGGVN